MGNTNTTESEIGCSGRLNRSCFNSDTHGITHVKSTMIRQVRTRNGLDCDYENKEHLRGDLWHRYSVSVYQVLMVTVDLSKSYLQLNHYEPCLQDLDLQGHMSWSFNLVLNELWFKLSFHNGKVLKATLCYYFWGVHLR